jgi:two-component system, OmpR family, sensor histidine kinase BaeS
MKLDITAKLFFILLAMSIAISATTGVVTRMSFKSQFMGYLNQHGAARLEALAPEFAEEYQRHGGWDYFRNNRLRWIEFLRTTARTPNSPDLASVHLRMVLLDANRRYVEGFQQDAGEAATMRPIIVNGRTVGFLALRSLENALTTADIRFKNRQLIASWIIGGSVALLAALAALWLSRTLLTPIQRITAATQQLADGDYTIRIENDSNDTVGRLARDFNRLAEKLQRNEQLRRNFMADIAHELRTPLAVLRGEIEAIVDRVREATPEALGSLQAEVTTLSKVIDDLYDLSLADIGALSYRMEPIDVSEALQSTLGAFRSRFAPLCLEPSTDIAAHIFIKADKARIQQLFNNLLENMARYTRTPGSLRIECAEHNGQVEIGFHDSGPGLTEEQRSHLFERFYRTGTATSTTTRGAGLGLAICRKIVEAHGGNIAAKSSPLGGLLIAIQLPSHQAGSA